MTVVIWIVLGALCLAAFVVCGALVEMYRSLEQLREHSGASDVPTKLDADLDPDVLHKAGIASMFTSSERALLLILSDRCSTCEIIAQQLTGGPPENVWILLHPVSGESGANWLTRHALDTSPSVLVDDDEHIVDGIGIRITPVALRIKNGSVVAAHTVPSSRRLADELWWVTSGGPEEPEYASPHPSYHALMNQLRNESTSSASSVSKGAVG